LGALKAQSAFQDSRTIKNFTAAGHRVPGSGTGVEPARSPSCKAARSGQTYTLCSHGLLQRAFSISECFAFALTDKNKSMSAAKSALGGPARVKEEKEES
jgi:hypothetical protein